MLPFLALTEFKDKRLLSTGEEGGKSEVGERGLLQGSFWISVTKAVILLSHLLSGLSY